MNHRLHCTCKLAQVMRDFLPLPGDDFKKLMLVDLQPGEQVAAHEHPEHVILHYPHDSPDPVLIYPRAGMLVYIPPGAVHEVPPVTERRQSIAMVVNALQAQD